MSIVPRLHLDETRPPVFLPEGGNIQHFQEAAADALHVVLRRPIPKELYNVYLGGDLRVHGATTEIENEAQARLRRKQAFTASPKISWSITIWRNRGKALVEHRSGFRCHFLKR